MQVKEVKVALKVGDGSTDNGLAEGEFEAYASTFTREPDSYGDVVAKGAFGDSLKEWADSGQVLPVLFGHRFDDPDYNIGGVVEAAEDDHGLKIRGQLDLDSPKAAQVHRLMKAKRIGQMSFAFDTLDAGSVEHEDGRKANELRKLKLYEVSVVPIGANQDTEILAVKAAAEVLLSGEKAGRVLAQKHIDSLRSAQEAIGVVITAAEAQDQEGKASGHTDAKDEEPTRAKSEEQRVNPSANPVLAELSILALNGQKGA